MRLPFALLACAMFLAATSVAGTGGVAIARAGFLPSDALGPETTLLPRPRLDVDPSLASVTGADAPTAQPRPLAIDYSDSYNLRRKVHYVASFATLPLFATEYVLGAKLYDGSTSESVRSAHGFVAGSLAALFGVNTVTGVWNLYEGRHDPSGRTRRILHGALMLVADAGFVATGMLAPESEEGEQPIGTSDKDTHRAVALSSMGVATVSYLIMLIGR